MAEAALLTSLGWVASPLIKILFDRAYHLLGTSIKKKKKKLEASVLPTLSLAIEKAEKSPNKEKLVDWLRRLKDAYYEAEEAIDLLEYEKLEQQVKNARKTLKQKAETEKGTRISLPSVAQPIKTASDKLISGFSVFSTQKMLKRCIDNLIEIAEEATVFRDLLGGPENANGSDTDCETCSHPPVIVFGREIDNEKIVGLLMKEPINFECGPSTRPAIPIIAITGRSGAGKTTLAQVVYKHMDELEHFHHCVWVHAPRKFEAIYVINKMIETIKAKGRASNDYPFTSLEALSTELRSMLGSKKLLLVLDDFWSDTEGFVEQWEKFIGCLRSCLPGSRILLTTQIKNVAEQGVLDGVTKVELNNLEEGPISELFMHYAWTSNSHSQKEEFEKIGQKIAVKLKGDPGAAMLLGRHLNGKNLRDWEKVAEKDWLGDNMKVRIWSYQQLPLDLQRCFAICSLFPKGTQFRKKDLINIWMAEGFIRPTENQERLEDIGEYYLHMLVSRFILEEVENNKEKRYQLHDQFHYLAERVQGDDFIRIDCACPRKFTSIISRKLSRSENIRHIHLPSSMINKLKEELCLMKNLCTFSVYSDYSDSAVPTEVLQKILKNMKKLRVLLLPGRVVDSVDFIGNLKHLRFLQFDCSQPLMKLPDSICTLYHLQTLVLQNCESLPKNFSELISLRCIKTVGETMSHISHIGKMTSLQDLNQFVVRKESGNELHQLENLNKIRGEMCIKCLENVGSIEDAKKANMRNKKHIEELKFEWTSPERDPELSEVELLDALQPHPHISGLTLQGFGGDRFPNWLLSQNSQKHLKSLTLINCDNVKEISSIDESISNCERLILRGLKNLKKMPSLPSNLTYLVMDHLPQLSYFSEDDLLMKEERKQSKLEAVKQIAECRLKLELKFGIFKPFLLFMKERLEAPSEIGITSSQCGNNFSEIVKFDPFNDDYSEDQILDAWVMYMNYHIETMFNKNEVQADFTVFTHLP